MTTIKLRRGTASQWTTANPVLAAGEPGYETNTGKHKIGDGTSPWSDLDYFLPESALSAAVAESEPLAMPAAFPTLPCTFYRNRDGSYSHDFDFAAYKTGTKIYVSMSGNDTTGTGAAATPYRTLTKALTEASAGAASSYCIIITDVDQLLRDEIGFTGTLTGKTVAVVSQVTGGTIIGTNASTYSWTLTASPGVYSVARSGVTAVVDTLVRDRNGVPVPLLKKTTLAQCQATRGSWYTDGTTLYVHRRDQLAPTTSSTAVDIGVTAFDPVLAGGAKLYLQNLIFLGRANGNGFRCRGDVAGTTETCVVKDCRFVGSTGNGYMSQQLAKTYLFDCFSAYGQLDGFNYSYDGMTWATVRANTLVVEFNCEAYHLGIETPGAGSNNASTGHGGVNVLRVGHKGRENVGATVIDVNGCRSVLYGCKVATPVLADGTPGGTGTTSYTFSSDSSAQAGEAWLYDCAADDSDIALNVGSNTTAHLARFRPGAGSISAGGTVLYDI